jgi:hypothetical protein
MFCKGNKNSSLIHILMSVVLKQLFETDVHQLSLFFVRLKALGLYCCLSGFWYYICFLLIKIM